jgi:hypothetical protein
MLSTKQKTIIVFAIVTIIAVSLISVTVAAFAFSKQFNYTVTNISATVDRDQTTVAYGILDAGTLKTEVFIVTNTGNTAIIVTPHATGTGATYGWNPTSATIQPAASATFTLTITVTGDGSTTVSFTAIKA